MATSGVNVARWTALGLGIFYGIYHQQSLNSQAKMNEITRKYRGEESLIAKAKAEWEKRSLPPEKKTKDGNIISDPDDPKFDLEAYLTMKMADEAK